MYLLLTYNVLYCRYVRLTLRCDLTFYPLTLIVCSVLAVTRDQTLYQIVAKSKIQRLIMAILILKICGPTQQPS